MASINRMLWTPEDWKNNGCQEKHLQSFILKELNKLKGCYAKGIKKGNAAGIPDILVCYHGHFLAFELKTISGKTTPLQDRNIEDIKLAGGIAIVARCWDDVIREIRKIQIAEYVDI